MIFSANPDVFIKVFMRVESVVSISKLALLSSFAYKFSAYYTVFKGFPLKSS